jgi:hypothetical protein
VGVGDAEIKVKRGFDAAASCGGESSGRADGMNAHGLPIYVSLEAVDMRFGAERLGSLVRERMRPEPGARALFVFVSKRE